MTKIKNSMSIFITYKLVYALNRIDQRLFLIGYLTSSRIFCPIKVLLKFNYLEININKSQTKVFSYKKIYI